MTHLTAFDSMSEKAQVAKLVDAADSKSAVRKDVLVRFRSWALNLIDNDGVLFFGHFLI